MEPEPERQRDLHADVWREHTTVLRCDGNWVRKFSGKSDNLKNDKNHALAILAEIAPQDGIEAMLATQMAAVHIAMMRHSRLMAGAETIPQLDVQEKVFNKLARTFTAQVEAMRKHRHGGQQKMTVEHVTVENGGQAIVGNVTKGEAYKMENNPMQSALDAPRCTARSKRGGQRCKAAAVRGWVVCRMHGARGGAPRGTANGNYVHGANTLESQLMAMLGRLTNRDARNALKDLNE